MHGGSVLPVATHTEPIEDPMTDDRLPLAELLAKTGDADFLRAAAEAVVQLIMCISLDLIGRTHHFGGDRGRGAEP